MTRRTLTLLPLLGLALAGAAAGTRAASGDDPPVVSSVDLERYMGTWYEISSMPNRTQKGCVDTVVYYQLRKDGGFELSNTCWKGETFKPYRGTAKRLDPANSAKFFARFLLWLGSPYWIIDLDPAYRWAAVGVPDRSQLWIISREPALDQGVYDGILGRVKALGYDVDKLVRTVHTGRKPSNPFTTAAGKG